MGSFGHLLYPWGFLFQGLAIVHFIRRRPDTFWIWVILFLGPIGAIIYLVAEALPDIGLLGNTVKGFSRRSRINALKIAIHDNPSVGNYEELGDLYMDDGKIQQARAAYQNAIQAGATAIDPFYHRGVCSVLLGDAAAALPDLELTVSKYPNHDFYRAAGLLAQACAQTGQSARADALFREATDRSTSSETYLNYAEFLAHQGRTAEARAWIQRVLDKRPGMPGYLRRRERPRFRRAKKLLKSLPTSA